VDPRLKPLIKDYFKYHIPFVLASVACFLLAFKVGPRTPGGLALVIAGSVSLILAPPVSLLMVRRKHWGKLARREGS